MTTIALIDLIKKETKIDAQGKATVSIRAAARIVGVKHPTLLRQFQGASLEPSKLATKLIEAGFEGGTLEAFSKTGISDIALSIVVQYYAMYAGRYCTEQARLVMSAFMAIGLRKWLQEQVEWSTPLNVEVQLADIRKSLSAIESHLTLPDTTNPTTKRRSLLASAVAHPNPQIKEIPIRRRIVLLVNEFCSQCDRNYRNVYQHLYRQYKERYGYDVYARCTETQEANKLNRLEADGELERFWEVSSVLLEVG